MARGKHIGVLNFSAVKFVAANVLTIPTRPPAYRTRKHEKTQKDIKWMSDNYFPFRSGSDSLKSNFSIIKPRTRTRVDK